MVVIPLPSLFHKPTDSHSYCPSLPPSAALMAKVISRDMSPQPGDRWRFHVNVQAVFKKSPSATGPLSNQQLRRSTILGLFVSSRDSECSCPRLRPNR